MQRRLASLALASVLAVVESAADPLPELRARWRYTRVAGLEVLSDCPDSTTRAYVQCVLQGMPLINLPRAFSPGPRLPQPLILTERFLDDELAPPGSPPTLNALRVSHAGLIPSDARDSDVWVTRVGLAHWSPIKSTLEVSHLPLRWVPWLLRGRTPRLPPWAEAGFAAIYGADESAINKSGFFVQLWAGQATLAAIRDAAGRPERLPPVAELFAEGMGLDGPAAARWRAHTALFVRWGLMRTDSKPEKFWEFLARACTEPASESLLRGTLGVDHAQLQVQLAALLERALVEPVTLRAPELATMPTVALRPATRAEICRIEGEWLRLTAETLRTSHPDLRAIYLARARRVLSHAYDAGDREPQLVAALGLCLFDAGELAAARRVLSEAHAAGAPRPLAMRVLARLELAEADRAPAGADRLHGAEQTLAVLRPLLAARQLPPSDAETCRLMTEAWAKSEASPTRVQLAELMDAAKPYPRESALHLEIARLAVRHGFHEEAAQVADRGLVFAGKSEMRDAFAQVSATARAAGK